MTSCALGLFRNVMRSLSGCFESGALSVLKLLDGIIRVRCFETAALSGRFRTAGNKKDAF